MAKLWVPRVRAATGAGGFRSPTALASAVLLSALAHALLFFFWSPSKPAPLAGPVLELTLSASVPAPLEDPLAAERPPVRPAQPLSAAEASPVLPEEAPRIPDLPAPETPAAMPPAPPEALDLTLPPGWAADREAADDTTSKLLPFNPGLSRALAETRKQRARSALLAARAGTQRGLDAAAFGTRRDALGETVKVDDACFALREDVMDAGNARWWMVSCGDPRENAYLRPAPEIDAVGRILAD